MWCFLTIFGIEIIGLVKGAKNNILKKVKDYTAPIFTEGDPGPQELSLAMLWLYALDVTSM
jgi:hypothetical protein